jgi:hypothetical protein
VTTGREDPRAAAHGRLRASDNDREQVIDTLKVAFAHGRLTKQELDLRAGQAFASRTYADLAAVTAGLPARSAEARPLPKLATAEDRAAESLAIKRGLGWGGVIVSALIAATILTNNEAVADIAVLLVGAYLMFLLIAVGDTVNSWFEKRRARKQLPPAPGGRGPRVGVTD